VVRGGVLTAAPIAPHLRQIAGSFFGRKTSYVYVAAAPRSHGGDNSLSGPPAAGPAAKLVGNVEIFAGQRGRTHFPEAPVGALLARLAAAHKAGLVGGQQQGDALRLHFARLEQLIVRAALQVFDFLLHEGQDGGLEVVEFLIFAEDEVEEGEVNRVHQREVQSSNALLVFAVAQGANELEKPGKMKKKNSYHKSLAILEPVP